MPESMAAPNAASTDRKGIAQQCTKGWRKIHIGTDEETMEVRAIEVTGSNIGDAPMLPELLNQIPSDQDIGSITAPSRACWHALPGSGRAPELLPETTRSVRSDT
jgi:hypothetical protein